MGTDHLQKAKIFQQFLDKRTITSLVTAKPTQTQPKANQCEYCAYILSNRSKCLARKAVYSYCHKMEHYRRVCRVKAGTVEKPEQPVSDIFLEEDDAFLGQSEVDVFDTDWTAQAEMDGIAKQFKLDTEAAVSVIENHSINPRKLKPPDKNLRGSGGIHSGSLRKQWPI
ncbi:hypothetical protein PoB_006562700 [Plakobranchus ocellatus]|uniref:Uncharacterized protein n=1 Tax=Plakobranchus ocellatus TaxID=259542 RepID=A0AAV4D4I0_9GAST|nr:hypothetical protein PoB_006562700 [Plakobranchus ocellatus]